MDENGNHRHRYFLGAEETHKEPPLGMSVSGTRSISELPEYEGGGLFPVVLEDLKLAT